MVDELTHAAVTFRQDRRVMLSIMKPNTAYSDASSGKTVFLNGLDKTVKEDL